MSTTGSDAPSTTNPSGGRKGAADTSDPAKAVTGLANPAAAATSPAGDKDNNAGFGLEHFDKDVKGSLKVHIKLDLDVDIHITARIRGDIAIGLL